MEGRWKAWNMRKMNGGWQPSKELPSFLFAVFNKLVACNTWFTKKDIHKATKCPGTKQLHCVNFEFMRRHQRMMCLDTSAMYGA